MVGGVLAAAVVFFALLTAFSGPSRAGSWQARGVDALHGPLSVGGADAGQGVGSGPAGGGWTSGDGGGGSAAVPVAGGSAPSGDGPVGTQTPTAPAAPDASAGPAASAAPVGSAAATPIPAVPDAPSARAAGSGSGRATAQINCTKEVLDESGLKDAVANAGPNDVICVKTNMASGPTGPPAAAPTPRVLPPASSDGPGAGAGGAAPKPADRPQDRSPSARTSAPSASAPPSLALPRRTENGQYRSGAGPGDSGGAPPRRGQGAAPRRDDSAGAGGAQGRAQGGSSGGGWFGNSSGGSSGGSHGDSGGNAGGLFGDSGGGFGSPGGGSGGGPGNSLEVQGGPPGAGTPSQSGCTKQVTDSAGLSQAIDSAAPGDRICITGDMGSIRLEISKGGSDQAPLAIIGNGRVAVKGITIKASNVVVDGFQVLNAEAPGIEITGNNVTVRNNTVKHPTGGDFDGLRFFGNNLKILHNTISDITNTGGAHADCMQTFTNGEPSSENVLIDGNRCENIDNQCLMAEGPGDVGDGGGGDGTSANWTWSNNICNFGASQGVMIEAVQNVTIRNNLFNGKGDKAIGLDIGSTGAKVSANIVTAGIGHEIGMDETSKKGYQGPQPQGGP